MSKLNVRKQRYWMGSSEWMCLAKLACRLGSRGLFHPRYSPITDLINASEELLIFFLLASMDFLSLKYRTTPSDIMSSPMTMRGVPTIFQNSLSTQCGTSYKKVEARPHISE
jgi:hypothetical protein